MKNKFPIVLPTIIIFLSFFTGLHANGIRGVHSTQEIKSKKVRIHYTLDIEPSETAKVEIHFSPDDGVNFFPCSSVSGDAGSTVTPGYKTAVWNAEADWNHEFTQVGRFKVIATVNIVPALDFSLVELPFQRSGVFNSPSFRIADSFSYMKTQNFDPKLRSLAPGMPRKYFVDKWEVTNGQWDLVVDWAVNHGYDLSKSPSPARPNFPVMGISINEVVKWLNARSEMEGLTPVFYLDPVEGQYADINNNGNQDLGLTKVFRKGRITSYLVHNNRRGWGFDLQNHVKVKANGYRLPSLHGLVPYENDRGFENYIFEDGEFWYLAMGGRSEQGEIEKYSLMQYEWGRMPGWYGDQTGKVYTQEWPWGSESPSEKKNISDYISAGVFTEINQRKGNNAGIQDMIGNVSEMTLNWTMSYITHNHDDGHSNMLVVGGNPYGFSSTTVTPREIMSVGKEVSSSGAEGVGFRGIRVKY